MPGENSDRIDELAVISRELVEQIAGLRSDNADQLVELARQSKSNRRTLHIVFGVSAFGLILTLLIGLSFLTLGAQSNRIDNITQKLDAEQQIQRQDALCPLYKLFLDLESPEGRKQAPDPKVYDKQFATLKQGYSALRCQEVFGPTQ